ncbi:phasin family protein [Caenimonas terrae]|uniref:Phasin family protein n=1 Tax=Caenimonas terrae TaxID=696074 RepID=A0ABW0NJD0_9BURK
MVTKSKTPGADSPAGGFPPDFSSTVKESAQQIWLAGLGAFAKAQEEGSKVFDTLVKEGVTMQRKTQAAAGEKISEATSKMSSFATEISSKASGGWDKLETIFEDRVAKALKNLGVPTASDIETLSARIDELNRNLGKLASRPSAAKRAAQKTAPPAAAKRKPARKSA